VGGNGSAAAELEVFNARGWLVVGGVQQQAPEKPDPRGVVELQDALDAVIQLAR